MGIKRRSHFESHRAGRPDLTFPKINNNAVKPNGLVGYHSFLNWLQPTLTFGRSLRLSLLLFDQVIAETSTDDGPELLLKSLVSQGQLDKRTSRRLLDLIVPITRIVPGFGAGDLLRESEDTAFSSFVETELDEEYLANGQMPPEYPDYMFKDMRYTLATSAFENWFALSKQMGCVFIPNSYEEDILTVVISFLSSSRPEEPTTPHDVFTQVVTKLLPTIDSLSLDDVLALRQHEYFGSFRKKTKYLVDRVSHLNDLPRILEEEERLDLGVLQEIFRPRPIPALVRTVLGSVPLNSFLNPISAYDGATSVARDVRAARDLGWLYFVRDFKENRARTSRFRTGDILGLH